MFDVILEVLSALLDGLCLASQRESSDAGWTLALMVFFGVLIAVGIVVWVVSFFAG